ncbi:hypothetical protein DFH11DRAFT_1470201, partial [Phellopilus nigrolimitatus]
HLIKTPMYNDPTRNGANLIAKLFAGHPDPFYDNFGMSKHTFQKLASELHNHAGFGSSKHISMAEQLAIFL